MNLLYLAGIDLPMRQARAVQTLHTTHALAEQGCRVRLVVGRSPRHGLSAVLGDYGLTPHPNLSLLSLPALRLPELPIAAYVHPRLAAWNWSYGLAAIAALRLLPAARRPELVFARDPRLAQLPPAGASVDRASKVVYEVHELFSTRAREPLSTDLDNGRPPDRTPRVRRMEQAVFRDAWRLIALTAACKAAASRGVRGSGRTRARRARRGSPGAGQTCRHVRARDARSSTRASSTPGKGSARWCGLCRGCHAPDSRSSAACRLRDPDAAALRELAGDLGVLGRVQLVGFLPHVEVADQLAGASVAVVPLPDNPMARYFTSPLKLFEYMAAGLPIVASDLPALREVLRTDENALLVPPDDPGALADAIGRLLADPALAERLRRRAHADVQDRTWAARAADMLSFLGA